jgi:hypothetical protein
MAENLMCPGMRVQSGKYRDNYDKIFGCGIDVATDEEVILMKKRDLRKWVTPEDVPIYERKGWRKE